MEEELRGSLSLVYCGPMWAIEVLVSLNSENPAGNIFMKGYDLAGPSLVYIPHRILLAASSPPPIVNADRSNSGNGRSYIHV